LEQFPQFSAPPRHHAYIGNPQQRRIRGLTLRIQLLRLRKGKFRCPDQANRLLAVSLFQPQ
jgi:hypothetical protein